MDLWLKLIKLIMQNRALKYYEHQPWKQKKTFMYNEGLSAGFSSRFATQR
jgi:hypothetical protein